MTIGLRFKPARIGLVLLVLIILAAFVFGGASRADALSQIPVRLVAIAITAIAICLLDGNLIRALRAPLLLLGGFAGIFLFQLVPLPPGLWTALPGRDLFAQTAVLAGIDQPWHPITLIPEGTLNSLLATMPGFAAVLALALVRPRDLPAVVALLALLGLLSGIVGLIQISSGNLYFFSVTNRGSAVGMFANRNHQAALLALTLPALAAAFAIVPGKLPAAARYLGAALPALFLVPLIVVTGSRAGLVLMLIGAVSAVFIMRSARGFMPAAETGVRRRRGWHLSSRTWTGIGAMTIASVIASVVVLARAPALQRLLTQDLESDARIRLFEPMTAMASDFFPFGAGFGTFATVFKVFEPAWRVGPSYFNHAHNDVLEIVIEGGLFSILIIAAGIAWWIRSTWRLWRLPVRRSMTIIGRLGTVQTLILALASLSDYPLRTALCQVVFMLGCGFMAIALHDRSASEELPVETMV